MNKACMDEKGECATCRRFGDPLIHLESCEYMQKTKEQRYSNYMLAMRRLLKILCRAIVENDTMRLLKVYGFMIDQAKIQAKIEQFMKELK